MPDSEQQEIARLRSEPAATPTTPSSAGVMAQNIVSKHPEATIPESDISLADIERKQSNPVKWTVSIVLVLAALIAPVLGGRSFAVHSTARVIEQLGHFTSYGIALVSWGWTTMIFVSLIMMIVDNRRMAWFGSFIVSSRSNSS